MAESTNPRRSMLPMLRRNRDFRRLLAALAVSQMGDWLYNLALLALVYDRTHSVTWTAATTCARVLPMVMLGPFGGVMADRYDRRRLMLVSDVVRAAMMFMMAGVAAAGLPVLLAPVLAAASTVASVVYPPCVAATAPRMVSDADLPAATAARSTVGAASIIAGPAGGALLLLLGSPAWAFMINATTFVASALLLLSLAGAKRFSPPAVADRGPASAGVMRDLRAGFAALRADRVAGRVIGADVVCSLAYGAQTVLLLMLSRRMGDGDSGYGYMLAGVGAGGLIGASMAARMRIREPRYLIGAVLLIVAAPSALLAIAPALPVAVALGGVVGAGSVMVEVMVDTSLARRLDESVLARAYGLAFPASIGGIAVGSLITAPLAGWLGLSGALVAVGGIVAAYALWVVLPARTGQRQARLSVAAGAVAD